MKFIQTPNEKLIKRSISTIKKKLRDIDLNSVFGRLQISNAPVRLLTHFDNYVFTPVCSMLSFKNTVEPC